MPAQRKRTASASLGSTETGRPTRKAGRFALSKIRNDNTHGEGEGSEPGHGQGNQPGPTVSQGVPDKFPWVGLPIELQEHIMSNLTVRDTASLTWAVQSCNVRAIHWEMVRKRHEALREIIRREGSERAARRVPPVDLANPARVDVYQARTRPDGTHKETVTVSFTGNARGGVVDQRRKGKKREKVLDEALAELLRAEVFDKEDLPGEGDGTVFVLPGRCKGCLDRVGGLEGAALPECNTEKAELWRRIQRKHNRSGNGSDFLGLHPAADYYFIS